MLQRAQMQSIPIWDTFEICLDLFKAICHDDCMDDLIRKLDKLDKATHIRMSPWERRFIKKMLEKAARAESFSEAEIAKIKEIIGKYP